MGKKTPLCTVSFVLVLIGAINWGLIGLGNFLGSDLNVVDILLGSWPTLVSVVYLLVGLAGLYIAVGAIKCSGGQCD